MKRSLFLSAVIACGILVGNLNAQTVATNPVGFNTSTITPALSVSAPSSTVVSAPFYAPADFRGSVSSLDSTSSFSFSGTPFTASQFTTTPHLARMVSGNSVGRFFLITANTTSQITVNTFGYNLVSGAPGNTDTQITVGDSCEICPANTLGSLFGTSSVPFQTGTTSATADNVYLFNGTTWDIFFNNGTHWKQQGNLSTNLDNTVVYPDRGMFILRRGTGALSLTFLGAVPYSNERTDFPGPGSSFKSNRFPVDLTLAGATNPLNLQTLPGWQTGTTSATADNVYLWNGTTWNIFFYNGTHWKQQGNLSSNLDSTAIPIGTAMFVVRRSTASGNNSTLVQTLPYTLP
ncbi:MAG: hypothetical protein ACXWIU_00490 [Limisphaerales bacterium]